MKDELQNSLVDQYPQIFQDIGKSAMESCMAWGIAVSDGWYDLIRKLCEDIMAINPPKTFKAEQVKEKFGGLRFYTSGGNEEINKLVNFAEANSYEICEYCSSKQGVTTEGRWVKSLCKNCREAKNTTLQESKEEV